jgi:apolipoprotein N-acyltransferase
VLLVIGAFLGLYVGLSTFAGRPQFGDLKLGVVQTDSQLLDDLKKLHTEASAAGADVVVWPELSGMSSAKGGTDLLVALAKEPGLSPFVTTFEESGSPLPYNAAAVFSVEGESEHYWKRKPFAGEKNIHSAGTKAVAIHLDGRTYGLNICFDSCFPSVMRETAKLEDVEAILLPTLDPTAPYGTVQAMHAAYTPFRAAELGLPIARADTTAYSMIVDGRGVIVAEAGSGTQEAVVANVEAGPRWTFYRLAGDWFRYLCALVAVVGAVTGRRQGARVPVPTE